MTVEDSAGGAGTCGQCRYCQNGRGGVFGTVLVVSNADGGIVRGNSLQRHSGTAAGSLQRHSGTAASSLQRHSGRRQQRRGDAPPAKE
ncbi:MAG: hypothetical protein II970_08050 [Paludibacteraceae bacterium]|nr:hypothetical protein [Paludibacteraceae bacterium]